MKYTMNVKNNCPLHHLIKNTDVIFCNFLYSNFAKIETMERRLAGREVWHGLLAWDKDSAAAERLAAQILIAEKYEAVDPSHPLGGRDDLKDAICIKSRKKFIAAC